MTQCQMDILTISPRNQAARTDVDRSIYMNKGLARRTKPNVDYSGVKGFSWLGLLVSETVCASALVSLGIMGASGWLLAEGCRKR